MFFEQFISASSLGDGSKPRHQAIAEEFAHAIRTGQLAPGEKYPPRRNLAIHLGVMTGTVSRAYAYLERVRMATARVGGGTYVRTREQVSGTPSTELPPELIDLAHNRNLAIPGDESHPPLCAY